MKPNAVTQFVQRIPESFLKASVMELREWSKSGVLADGLITSYARDLDKEIGCSYGIALSLIETSVLKRAAYYYATLTE